MSNDVEGAGPAEALVSDVCGLVRAETKWVVQADNGASLWRDFGIYPSEAIALGVMAREAPCRVWEKMRTIRRTIFDVLVS